MTLSEMFFEINKSLCDSFNGLDPIKILDYPAEDVFELINNMIAYSNRNNNSNNEVIKRKAGDDWF